MLLNRFEKLAMNNPVRAAIQRGFEANRLLRLGGRLTGGRALEIGCGRGVGVEIILDRFGVDCVDAFDLDREIVSAARRRLRGRGGVARLFIADTVAIPTADDVYDAVFDFGVIHHISAWREALREIARVLKHGGRLYGEEVLARGINLPLSRLLFEHPAKDRFDHRSFVQGLEEAGLKLVHVNDFYDLFAFYVAEKA